MQLKLTDDIAKRSQVATALEEFCQAHSVTEAVRYAADLALEEHLTNLSTHGHAHEMIVSCRIEDDFLLIEVEDDGITYDPCSRPPVDINVPLDQKPIGGLGIHLMKEFLDDLSYFRRAGRNVLRMKKRLNDGEACRKASS